MSDSGVGSYEATWHTDGHVIFLQLEQSNLQVSLAVCPHEKQGGPCSSREAPCIVEYFINNFGLECNVGSSAAQPEMEIAWTLLGDDFDLASCQLWWLPLEDTAFASWLGTRESL
tara:strand:+ start:5902 stop:6246 length:345 start_codon:yes stop_codon:yes gene_type:complete